MSQNIDEHVQPMTPFAMCDTTSRIQFDSEKVDSMSNESPNEVLLDARANDCA